MFDKIKSIKLSGITLKNFMAFDDFEVSGLENNKIIFIAGTNALGKSTITSESIYYSLFGKSLRFKKIISLLKRGVLATEDSFSKICLDIKTFSNEDIKINMLRNVIKDPRFSITTENDSNNIFEDLINVTKSKKINNVIKNLFDIDENKFSVLYLKSPFVKNLFESDSELLSSITKVNFINDLRKDFNGIIIDINNRKESLEESIRREKNAIEGIEKQIKALLDSQSSNVDNISLIKKKESNVELLKNNLKLSREKKELANNIIELKYAAVGTA